MCASRFTRRRSGPACRRCRRVRKSLCSSSSLPGVMAPAYQGRPLGSSAPPVPAPAELAVFMVVVRGCGAGASGARAPLGVRLAAFAAADPGSRGHSRSLVRGRHRAGRSRCLRRPAPSCGSSSSVSSCLTVNPERVCSSHPVLPSRAVILIAVPTRIWSVFLPARRYHQGAPRNAFVTRERVSRDRKDLAA